MKKESLDTVKDEQVHATGHSRLTRRKLLSYLAAGGAATLAGTTLLNQNVGFAEWRGTVTESVYGPGSIPPIGSFIVDVTAAPYHASGDGATDDTSAIQAAATAAENGILVIPKPAVSYLISSTIELPSNIIVIGIGHATICLKANSNCTMVQLNGKQNVTLTGLTLDGNRENQSSDNSNPFDMAESHHAIKVINSRNVTIRGCKLTSASGDGAAVAGQFYVVGEANLNRQITIVDNEVLNNGRNGISIIHADGVWIKNNDIHGHHAWVSTLGAGIDIEPNRGINPGEQWIVRNVAVENNILHDNNVGGQIIGWANSATTIVEHIAFRRNSIYRNNHRTAAASSKGLYVKEINNSAGGKYSDIVIAENDVYENGFVDGNPVSNTIGIHLDKCNVPLFVRDNRISGSGMGIQLHTTSNATVQKNHIYKFGNAQGGSGITLYATESSYLLDNRIHSPTALNNFSRGISITALTVQQVSRNLIVTGNIIGDSSNTINASIGMTSNNAGWPVFSGFVLDRNVLSGYVSLPVKCTNCSLPAISSFIGKQVLNGIQSHYIVANDQFVPYYAESSLYGPSSERPVTGRYVSMSWFDSTLGKPIWWNGSAWIDAAGTLV
ncbi:right-handed parallel beta-helix repeat-containing protein [Paenibacillus hodogayensis]|uniref:Right-handed parallel beta-helix repeat-containing protein n=1 Tax=Paenibacillus hodogayensis TaxID=279208 RepID=A0ABV5VPB7_9BACL